MIKPKSASDLIKERNATHGSFSENARISQRIKEILRESDGWETLLDHERESLDQIALKISRILSGKSLSEHWEDIEGYARLTQERT